VYLFAQVIGDYPFNATVWSRYLEELDLERYFLSLTVLPVSNSCGLNNKSARCMWPLSMSGLTKRLLFSSRRCGVMKSAQPWCW
ncbi:MAG: hypothetical protein ACI8WW_001861, partial [Oceanospirillaceae bacterium]